MDLEEIKVIPKQLYTIENNTWKFGYKWSIFNLEDFTDSKQSSRFSSGLHNIRDVWFIGLKIENNNSSPNDRISIHLYLESLRGASELSIKVKYTLEISEESGSIETPILTEKKIQPGSFIDFKGNSILKSILLNKDEKTAKKFGYLDIICDIEISLNSIINIKNSPIQIIDDFNYNQSTLSIDMALALENEKFGDVIFRVGETSFKVMKGILAARSQVLAKMFEHQKMLDNRLYVITISDIEEKVFKELLLFIYTNNSPNIESMPVELFVAAEKYKLIRLKNMCEEVIIKNMTVNNVLGYFEFANMSNAKNLRKKSIEFIQRNLKVVTQTQEFQIMKETDAEFFVELLLGMAEN